MHQREKPTINSGPDNGQADLGQEALAAAVREEPGSRQAEEALLAAGALQNAIFNSANFSSIATDAKGVIQIFNVGAERMLGYAAAEVTNKITPADISDPQELITPDLKLWSSRLRAASRTFTNSPTSARTAAGFPRSFRSPP